MRLVRAERRDGEAWILATSLVRKESTADNITDADTCRWRIDEFYRCLVTTHVGQGQFHTRSTGGLHHEISAQWRLG